MVLAVKTKAKGDASLVEHDVIEVLSDGSGDVNGVVQFLLQ
jgi:hypothetical protein